MEPMIIKLNSWKLQGQQKHVYQTNLSDLYLFTHDAFTLYDYLPLAVLLAILRRFTHPWIVPRQIVVKVHTHLAAADHEYFPDTPQRQEDERKMCERELEAYTRMRSIQGSFIPICYGPVTIEGNEKQSALALQYLNGKDLGQLLDDKEKDAGADWTNEHVCDGIRACFTAITKLNVSHCDVHWNKLNNLMYADAICSSPVSYVLALTAFTLLAVDVLAVSLELFWGWLTPPTLLCYFIFSCSTQLLLPARSSIGQAKQVFIIDFGDWDFDDDEECQRYNMCAAKDMCKFFVGVQDPNWNFHSAF